MRRSAEVPPAIGLEVVSTDPSARDVPVLAGPAEARLLNLAHEAEVFAAHLGMPVADAGRLLGVRAGDVAAALASLRAALADGGVLRPGDEAGSSIDALRAACAVRDGGPATPARKGECAMFLDGHWYTIDLEADAHAGDPIKSLDVSLLHDAVLAPLLGVGDERTDKRIDFVGGIRGTKELEGAVASGRAAVAFSMYPVTVPELMAIADAGSIMPPKSTWFEPKLRDGFLSHLI